MTLTTNAATETAPRLSPLLKARLIAAAVGLWRVTDSNGLVIGHIQSVADARGPRYRARRFHPSSRAFRDLGEFWSADEAVECLVFAR